jgi:hypothetical protein
MMDQISTLIAPSSSRAGDVDPESRVTSICARISISVTSIDKYCKSGLGKSVFPLPRELDTDPSVPQTSTTQSQITFDESVPPSPFSPRSVLKTSPHSSTPKSTDSSSASGCSSWRESKLSP